MWMEFDRVSPLGDERGDIRNAQIVKAVFGAQGMNVALKDAMLCWGEDEDKPEVDPFAALEDAVILTTTLPEGTRKVGQIVEVDK